MPPLPPNTLNTRSHSLDGLLDTSTKTQWSELPKLTGEGLKEKNSSSESTKLDDSKETIKSKNRRSKSLDDLLDEDDDILLLVEDERETQSMENILENSGNAESCDLFLPVSPAPSEKLCENEVITVDCSIIQQNEPTEDHDDSGIQCDTPPKLQSDTSSLDEDALSNTISITSSTASERKSGKTFLNKYVKKVKNLMKK